MKTTAEIYRYSVDPNSDSSGANILRFVGTGKTVLEIGAGPGSIARPLVELNRSHLTAIERDTDCVEILSNFCEAYRADLNDPCWTYSVAGRRFEAVVIADVLEHLLDPWTTLKQAAGLLADDGSVVASIPHTGHAAILGCLLNNDFPYGDWGLLDRTHIRFFGMKNIQTLFEDAGLKVADFAYVLKTPEQTEFAELWQMLPACARALLEDGDFAHVYQVVLRAIPAMRNTGTPGYHLPSCKAPRTINA